MTECYIDDKRVVFILPTQKDFFKSIGKLLKPAGTTWAGLAKSLGVTPRTIQTWRRSDFLIKESTLLTLCSRLGESVPEYSTKPLFWSTSKAGIRGHEMVVKKYGKMQVNADRQRRGWQEWLRKARQGIKTSPLSHPKEVFLPPKSEQLAEWVGVVLGDGGITPSQIVITLNSRDDSHYARYISKLTKNLFKVQPSAIERHSRSIIALTLSRIKAVRYCRDELEMLVGNKIKQGVTIPKWISQGSSLYKKACIKGLFDTDGTVTTHTYLSGGKSYSYKKLSFTSASPRLLSDYRSILSDLGIKCRITKDGKNVVVESKEMVVRYFSIVGSSNPKHLKRYKT